MVFLNWPRVQLDLPLVRRKASHMGVHAQISSEADLLTDASTHSSSSTENMVRIPGGTFRMGSDRHYPEEAPVHRVTVSDFWIDAQPVTNRQFKEFVNATRHVTFAEFHPIRMTIRAHFRTCCLRVPWLSLHQSVLSICATGVSGGPS